MSIKGSRNYCHFCRRDASKTKLVTYIENDQKVCLFCKGEISKKSGKITFLEKRFTFELEQFLVLICTERNKTIPYSRRYKKKIIFSERTNEIIDSELLKILAKELRSKTLKELKREYFSTIHIYTSKTDMIFVKEEICKKSGYTDYNLIGRIELNELFSIIR